MLTVLDKTCSVRAMKAHVHPLANRPEGGLSSEVLLTELSG